MKHRLTKSNKVNYRLYNFISILALLIFFISSFSYKVQASSSVIDQARQIIRDNYVSQVPDSVLNQPTIEDIIKGLNDPYSAYFSKSDEQDFLNAIDNKTYGIGIYVEIVAEGVKVRDVIKNSPAEEVSIKAGDIVISANGQSLVGLTADKATSYIKGEAGTKVDLRIKRDDSFIDMSVERREITLPTVDGEMINDHTAYIYIVSFGEDTAELFSQKLRELRMKNPDNYIIDLRYNGGGYMSTALDIAGNFIGENPAITIEDREGNKARYWAENTGSVIDEPIIFLVNQYTASASEILSAAVKDYKKAYFIGTTTYGKGVAQRMFDLDDGSSLKLTTEKFYSPIGNTIQKVGVSPDFQVPDDVDSLAVADLFTGKCRDDVDKSGYIKVNQGGKEFEIDLNLAKDDNHWAAFKYILNKTSKDNVYLGTNSGWVKAPQDYFDNIYKFLYGNYKAMKTLKDVSEDKTFSITFNRKVNINTIKDNAGIELINSQTGERAAFDIQSVDDKKISIIPQEKLKSGETYYLKIKDVINPITVK
ncbi:S41 family peptidase [Clostridium sp. DJ247]|uniref:S41 family peptidase n=1 Tax=Clostridium sp. DJ247 TaxID=2726188 RepID=UPI0016291443|nr:S41 family peptidase [Clostridium sp. DJ247]MBC2580184.1 PDZ domain-containing protein [Clostridium sp. DJ247]